MNTKPVFFAWTRSFWIASAAVAALFAGDTELMDGLSQVIALVAGYPFDLVDPVVDRLVPAAATLLALHQRSGAARPYTMKVSKDTLA